MRGRVLWRAPYILCTLAQSSSEAGHAADCSVTAHSCRWGKEPCLQRNILILHLLCSLWTAVIGLFTLPSRAAATWPHCV